MAGRGTINYPSHMGNEDTANSRSPETQILIKSYTLHFLTMFLALWVTHFLCAYKVVCCSCSQSQQARIFFSFHMIWLKISGNLDVSFGVFHWLRTRNCRQERHLRWPGVSVLEWKGENHEYHHILQEAMTPWPRLTLTGLEGSRGPGGAPPLLEVPAMGVWACRGHVVAWCGALLRSFGAFVPEVFPESQTIPAVLARPGLAHSDACARRGALG